MASLILTSDDLTVRLDSRRLEVITRVSDGAHAKHEKRTVPLHDLDRVVAIGRPAITIPVLIELMDQGIPCFFVSSRGRWRGATIADRNLNARRRLRQYEQSRDRLFCLSVAQCLIEAKIRNSRRVLQRLAANRAITDEREHVAICNELKHYAECAMNAESHDEHFEVNSADGGTYLTQAARKPYFQVYEQTMKRRFALRSGEAHTDFRKVMDNEVCRFLRALEQNKFETFFQMP